MKILFFSHAFYPEIGGIESISLMLADNFYKRQDVSIIVVTRTKENGNLLFPFQVVRDPSIKTIVGLLKWCDVVFENNPCFGMSWPNLIFRRPKVVGLQTWLGMPKEKKKLQQVLKKTLLFDYNAVIACSNKIRAFTFKNAIVIGNPYDSTVFRQNSVIKNNDFVFVGRLVSDKGADMCIELLNDLKKFYGKEHYLTIIGDGPEMKKLKNLTSAYKLTNQIRFLGFLTGETIAKELNDHRFLLVPSRWEEPFGIVALEGMACGSIPIVSDGGGLPDAVGEAGIVFERNNIDSLFDKVKMILKSPEEQERLRSNSMIHLSKHQPDYISQRYYDLILKAYNSKPI